jgi:hypothetical protein
MNIADIVEQLRNKLDALDLSILALERLAAGRQPGPARPLKRVDKAKVVAIPKPRATSGSIRKRLA